MRMKPEFRKLRTRQIDRALAPFVAAKGIPRPQRGWIRAIREAAGISLTDLAKKLGVSPQSAGYLEKSETAYRISLGNLRDAADALGCELVYSFVPKTGTVADLWEEGVRNRAAAHVRAAEHTMALEDQAVGGVEEKIEEFTKRKLKSA